MKLFLLNNFNFVKINTHGKKIEANLPINNALSQW